MNIAVFLFLRALCAWEQEHREAARPPRYCGGLAFPIAHPYAEARSYVKKVKIVVAVMTTLLVACIGFLFCGMYFQWFEGHITAVTMIAKDERGIPVRGCNMSISTDLELLAVARYTNSSGTLTQSAKPGTATLMVHCDPRWSAPFSVSKEVPVTIDNTGTQTIVVTVP
ncbi:hypothetical protein [Bifidobacterium moraviense]|uniref:hypothetical protein n=1 Tax=Bifidobacterium moraviense TaxID=2675323 RepID=UPI00145F26F6|nr:hypothetical protein [Bifidobacterium sp. DSM 109958]